MLQRAGAVIKMANKHIEVVRNMITGFHQTYNEEEVSRYLSCLSDDVHWYDHAFRICRVGRHAISGLRTAWLHCNQPFDTEIKVGISTA